MPTAEEPKQNVREISVGIFYVSNYLMESRKEILNIEVSRKNPGTIWLPGRIL